jgi:hypothetical protein
MIHKPDLVQRADGMPEISAKSSVVIRLGRPAEAITLRDIYSPVLGEKSLWAPRAVPHQCLVSSNVERHFVDLAARADDAVLRTLEHKTLADCLSERRINDTVVVFDRIRENRRKYKRMKLADLINLSTNQIATRTTFVSAATALSVVPMLFGGPVLLNCSAAILFGILIGTLSSTYVAAALLLYLPAPAGTDDGPTEAATV